MKALDAKQLLIVIFILCLLTSGIAFIGFWQHRTISKIRAEEAAQAEQAVLEQANIEVQP